MKTKKFGTILLWLSFIIFFSVIVIYVIGCNSNYLINDTIKNISLFVGIISVLFILLGLLLVLKFKKTSNFNKVIMWIFSILVGIYILGCTSFLVLLYGPNHRFRDWLVTTAMSTMNHQYYCKWFYNDDVIMEVQSNNYVDDHGAETDESLVNHEKVTEYKNEYEKEILERKEGTLYKVINFKVNGCKAYLGIVYDPSKVSVGVTKKVGEYGQYIDKMAKEQNAVLAINGGAFFDPNHNSMGGTPIGVTISNGKIITNYKVAKSRGIIGFNKDDTLVLKQKGNAQELIDAGIRDAVTMGPFLIVNGKPSFIKGNGGWGYAARTAIGQRKDGIVLMLVVDSNEYRSKGASMADLTEIMQRYGAVNAANLDGGTSSVMVVEGTMINDPIDSALRHKTRPIADMFKVVE